VAHENAALFLSGKSMGFANNRETTVPREKNVAEIYDKMERGIQGYIKGCIERGSAIVMQYALSGEYGNAGRRAGRNPDSDIGDLHEWDLDHIQSPVPPDKRKRRRVVMQIHFTPHPRWAEAQSNVCRTMAASSV